MDPAGAVDGGADSDHMADLFRKIDAKEAGQQPSQAVTNKDDGTAGLLGDIVQPPAQQLAGLIWTVDVPIDS